ncbi:uncharacterized protein HD556DRAFT_691720 [Suillus plorans]|uniref:Uncharacterized protein n=1 Tax=Suillus plorans TaxID=116603 RepID=A0A9P7AKT5_9AGAM|nr:uncharacterized protein HD556DRAFT_691720 [Suillus plorans]KAG1790493.1 hypothetical protein HD556DRAFT_691720 [Suillus plorans]
MFPFSVPVYEPPPYALSGLSFSQLPMYTQRYLQFIAKSVPPDVPEVDSISDKRSIISMALFRSLIGNDMALVRQRDNAIAMARKLRRGIPPQATTQWHLEEQLTRIQFVLDTLLPERELIFNEFMIKFDALVWLDQRRWENCTSESWQKYRDALLEPILDRTSTQLTRIAQGKSIENMHVINGYTYRAPSLPYSPSGSSRASRARFRRSAACGPEFREDRHRGC